MSGWVGLPPTVPGMRIGLYGGTFNPPHAGHVLVARTALKAAGLHRLWWMVSPGNPLKSLAPPPIEERIALSRALTHDPDIVVTGVEAAMATRFTIDSLRFLRRRCPGVRFVYVMGADSFASLHHWKNWREIMRLTPIVVIDRPGQGIAAARSVAAQTFPRARIPARAAAVLPRLKPPRWVLIYGRRSSLSSTALRRKLATGMA